jgi:hypothetical protein
MSKNGLVTIYPVEWDLKRFRCYRYLDILFDELPTKDKLLEKLKEERIRNVAVEEHQDCYIKWQRKERPPILIDLKKECIRTEIAALRNFDREDIEHQASLVLRLLKKYKFASFLRKRVSFLPSLIGYNKNERKQYHELIERGIRRRREIYGYAPITNRKMSRERVNEKKNMTALKRHEVIELQQESQDSPLGVFPLLQPI